MATVHLKCIRVVLLLFISYVCTNLCGAQDNVFISLTKYNPENGLSSANVRKILRDKFGFVWIATQGGLNRFDGREFIVFSGTSTGQNKLLGEDISDIVLDSSGNYLWVLNAYAGINRIDIKSLVVTDTFSSQRLLLGNKPVGISRMASMGPYLYISSDDGIIIRFNVLSFEVEKIFKLPWVNQNTNKIEIISTIRGNVWVGLANGVIMVYSADLNFLLKKIIVKNKEDNSPLFEFKAIGTSSKDDIIYFVSKSGLSIYSGVTLNELPDFWLQTYLEQIFPKNDINNVYIDENAAWVITSEGLFQFKKGHKSFIKYNVSGNKSDNEWFTSSIHMIKHGNQFWLGSAYGLAYIEDINGSVSHYYNSYSSTDKLKHCIHIIAENENVILICTTDGLYKADLNNALLNKITPNLFLVYGCSLPENKYLISGSKGSFILDNFKVKKVSDYYQELSVFENDEIVASAVFKDSLYFFASQFEKGIYIWDRIKRQVDNINVNTSPVNIPSNVINRLFLDSKNLLWIVCDDLIAIYDPVKKSVIRPELKNPENNKDLTIIMDICETKEYYWLPIYGVGLARFDKNLKDLKLYTEKDGLENVGLYKVLPSNDSLIYVTSNKGLAVLNYKSNGIRMLYREDGLHSNMFEEFSANKVGSKLLMGGINGLTVIDEKKISSIIPEVKLYFSQIATTLQDGKSVIVDLFINNLSIPNSYQQVKVTFSGIGNIHSSKIRFSYKLDDKKWTNIGKQNFIDLLGIPPGKHELIIKATVDNITWSSPITLHLTFLPKWYQTIWFKFAVALAVLSLLYGFYRYRINQIRKQEQIRREIAGDLHDDIGSTLNSIKVFSNLALIMPEKKEYLEQIKTGAQNAITSVRDLIWVLDDQLDSITDLTSRFEQFALPLAKANNINLVREMDNNLHYRNLSKKEKRNFYLILKESFNNCVKYAGCDEFRYGFSLQKPEKLGLKIQDNGSGFAVPQSGGGNGLKNMRERSKQMGYSFDIHSSHDKGTSIIITKT